MSKTAFMVVERQSKAPSDVIVYRITKISAYNGGYAMEYAGRNQRQDVVYVPKNYPFTRRNGAVWVGKVAGNNSAAVVRFGPTVGASLDPDCPGEDLSMLVRTDLMARGYRTVYEKKIPWKAVILIGVAVLAVIVIITIMRMGGNGA